MTCEEYQFELSASLDGGLPIACDFTAHIDGCEACRRFAAEVVALEQILPLGEDEPVGSELHGRIMSAVRAPEPQQPPVLWPRHLAAVAAAAAVVFFVWTNFQEPVPALAPTVAESSQPMPTIPVLGLDMPAELTSAVASPYEQEFSRLVQDVTATTQFLARLGGQELALQD
jgi:hypothetical protein